MVKSVLLLLPHMRMCEQSKTYTSTQQHTWYAEPVFGWISVLFMSVASPANLSSRTHLLLAGSHLNPTLPLRCLVLVALQTTLTDRCLLLQQVWNGLPARCAGDSSAICEGEVGLGVQSHEGTDGEHG